MKSTIFYFSGTGNSYYVAKKISDVLGDSSVYSMANYHSTEQIGDKNETVGFVFPSYFGNLPRIVRKFIDEINISPHARIFCIITMGGVGQGSIAALQKALNEKGLKLCYGRGIRMPGNYIIKYNPFSIKSGVKCNSRADKKLESIADDIKNNINSISKNFISAENLYKNINELDNDFYVENQCTGCGLCEKICPVQNIKLIDARPQWQHHCEHCVACISWCPKEAIQYGEKTKKRRRYHNPAIHISDLGYVCKE